MSLQNVYYKRATATPRACYVCFKPTTTCLATANAVDFLYTCEAHLSDTGFATELVDPASASNKQAASKEEIARIKAEWEAKEAQKKEKAKVTATSQESGKNGDGKGEDEKRVEDGKNGDGAGAGSPSPSPSASGSGAAAAPTHKRYSLHRNFYAMRQDEHRRRRQTKQMQELAPRFPGAPHGSPVS